MRKLVIAFLSAIFLLGAVASTATASPIEHSNGHFHGDPFDHSN